MKNTQNDIILFMESNLYNSSLSKDLIKANELLKNAQKLFKDYGLITTSDQLNCIITEFDSILDKSKSIKEACDKIKKNFLKNSTDIKFDDEILKLDLNDDEIQFLEDIVISEIDIDYKI